MTSAGDPRLAGYRRLVDRTRHPSDVFVVESKHVVRRLLESCRHPVRSVLGTESTLADLGGVLDATDPPPDVLVADVALLRDVTGFAFHRGCLALAERGAEPALDVVLAATAPGPARVLVLDRVSDPDNVGALFRNAAAFGVRAVLLSGGCGDPLYRKAIRVSMGSTLSVPWARLPAWPEAGSRLRAHGFTVVGLTPEGEDLERFAPSAPARLALVVGNEGDGLSLPARGACDATAGIPMPTGMTSLNVAAAAAVALYRCTRCPAPAGR